jgi:hypothetical protein
VAVEVRAELGHHQRGWREDHGGRVGDGGGGGVGGGVGSGGEGGQVAGMVWGSGVEDVVRMVRGWRHGGWWHNEHGEFQQCHGLCGHNFKSQ